MTDVSAAFGANLKRLRLQGGLRQEDLAAKARVSRPTLASAERGACGIRLENAVKIARALGVTVDEMLTDGPETPSGSPYARGETQQQNLGEVTP